MELWASFLSLSGAYCSSQMYSGHSPINKGQPSHPRHSIDETFALELCCRRGFEELGIVTCQPVLVSHMCK